MQRPTVRDAWSRLHGLPLGTRIFSRVVGHTAPYTSTIGAHVVELSDGRCLVELPDRPRVRNHLKSVHAIALINLAEVATGLAVLHVIDGRGRGIVTGLRIEYFKKARGTITAEGRADVPQQPGAHQVQAVADLKDADGDVVARAWADWKIDLAA